MTNKTKLILEIRELLAKAEIEEALSKLSIYFSTASEDREGADTLVQIRAQFERLRSQQLRNTINAENAQIQLNQINDRLLGLLEQTTGLPKQNLPKVKDARGKNALIALGVIGGLVLAVVLFIVLRDETPQTVDDEQASELNKDCPEFDLESKFNIMVLPFQALDNEPINIHVGIQNRLATESEVFSLPTSVRINEEVDPTEINTYPLNGKDAQKLARPCDARLIIWGSTEKQDENNIVITRFKFVDLEKDHFALTKLRITENSDIDTLTSISAIAADGQLTKNIEQSIKLIFGIIAHETDQDAIAIEMLEEAKIDDDDTANTVLRNMILADSYIKSGQKDKALLAYDSVLQKQPDNMWALNNSAALNFNNGNYIEAADFLSKAIIKEPGNPDLRTQRAAVYLKTDRLDKARTDLEQIKVRKGVIDKRSKTLIQQLEKKEALEEKKIKKSDSALRRDPNNASALKDKTEALYHLGKYTEAQTYASQIIAKMPREKLGYIILSETELEKGDTAGAKRTLQAAMKQNLLNTSELKLIQPALPGIQKIQKQN